MILPVLVLLPLAGALLPVWFARWGRDQASLAAGGVTGVSLSLLLSLGPAVFAGETLRTGWAWIPSVGLQASFMVDGLGWFFALLILGIGILVVLYARYYLGPEDPIGRFYAYLLLFMGSMLGIVLSDNLVLLLVFWEMTSLASFLLIGYWHHRREGRQGARMALVVTGAGGLALMAGILLLGQIAGTYELSELLALGDTVRSSPLYVPALLLVLVGAFTKSAQFPFHFWLPHAMAAPTPVSAYLHSATMVKAGIFLLARLHPILAGTSEWVLLVGGAGVVTLLVGAYLAVLKHDLKSLLAFSTVSHLGLIVALLGFGTRAAVVAALFHVLNHAAFKAALFMNAGIVDHETGTRDIRRLGGLARHMPVSAGLALLGGAAMAGLPPLNGFLSKEMFLEETLHVAALPGLGAAPSWLLPGLGAVAAILGVAYSVRYVVEVYWGPEPSSFPRDPHEPRRGMRLPVELLIAVCVLVGLLPQAAAGGLVGVASAGALGAPPEVHLALWHGFNLPLLLSGIGLVGGFLLWSGRERLFALHEGPLPLPVAKRVYDGTVAAVVSLSDAVTDRLESGSLQNYLALLVTVALAVAAVPVASGSWVARPGTVLPVDLVSVAGWIILATGAIGTVVLHRRRILAVVSLSVVGLVVALAFVHFSAPDLALTQISVEVVTIVLLLLALYYLPPTSPVEDSPGRRLRHALLAAAAGIGMAAVTWFLLTQPFETISGFHIANSKPGGGGTNVVNVILVDFRGYDTLGEITVLGIAALGIYALIDGLQLPSQWDPRDLDDEESHPLILLVVTRMLLPLALVVGVYLFLRGHNHPGGGFIAGLVVSVALILQFVAAGIGWSQARLGREYHPVIGFGLLAAGLTGVGAWLFGRPFLTSWFDYFHLPLVGEIELASAVLFDLGVFLVVVGSVLLILVNLGKMSEAERVRLPERFRTEGS